MLPTDQALVHPLCLAVGGAKEANMVNQNIVEDGQKRSLQEFVESAILYLEQHPECDEVVQLAENINELELDVVTDPKRIFALPEGYEYNFSGFYGQVIGVGRTGIRLLHKGRP